MKREWAETRLPLDRDEFRSEVTTGGHSRNEPMSVADVCLINPSAITGCGGWAEEMSSDSYNRLRKGRTGSWKGRMNKFQRHST